MVVIWVQIVRSGRGVAEGEVDLIVVLGAALWQGVPCPELSRRLARAAMLYRDGVGGLVLCSGGFSAGRSEAAAMREELCRQGVPAGAILVDETGSSTRRSIRAVAGLLPGRPRVLFVSSAYHVHRVLSEARRNGLDAVAAPVPLRTRRAGRQHAREVIAICAYAVTATGERIRATGARAADA